MVLYLASFDAGAPSLILDLQFAITSSLASSIHIDHRGKISVLTNHNKGPITKSLSARGSTLDPQVLFVWDILANQPSR